MSQWETLNLDKPAHKSGYEFIDVVPVGYGDDGRLVLKCSKCRGLSAVEPIAEQECFLQCPYCDGTVPRHSSKKYRARILRRRRKRIHRKRKQESFDSVAIMLKQHGEPLDHFTGLTDDERATILLRFGFIGQPRTYDEVANQLGWSTRERARQVVNKALRKLRHPMRSEELEQLAESIPA